jgi:hypothetical protein
MGLDISDDSNGLGTLLKRVWILANLIGDKSPMVRFRPGIADLGTWCCHVDINYETEGKGGGEGTISGTIEGCSEKIRQEIAERLGGGYV